METKDFMYIDDKYERLKAYINETFIKEQIVQDLIDAIIDESGNYAGGERIDYLEKMLTFMEREEIAELMEFVE